MKSMKNLLFIVIFSLLVSVNGYSKSKFGVMAGVSNSTFLTKNVTTGSDYIILKMPYSDYGIHAGGFYELNLGAFLFQSELYLSSITNTYKISDPNPLTAVTNIYKNDRNFNLEMPLLFGVKAGPMKFMLGPSGRLVLCNLNQLRDYTGYNVVLNRALWSIQTGIGLEIKRLQLNMRYEIGVSKVAHGITVDGTTKQFDSRANQILISIGWAFK